MSTGNVFSSVKLCLRILKREDRRKYFAVIVIQGLMGIFDLVGVGILGVIGALSIQGVQSRGPGNRVSKVLEFFGLDSFTFQAQVAILVLMAVVTLVLKTLATIYLTRRILYFLGAKSAQISSEMISKALNRTSTSFYRTDAIQRHGRGECNHPWSSWNIFNGFS